MTLRDVFRKYGLVFNRDVIDVRFFQKDIDTIIVDGSGYRPLMVTDHFLLERKAGSILRGLEYLIEAAGAGKAIIAVNETYSNAISGLQESPERENRIQVFPIGDFYPAGDEYVLVYETTGRIVGEGGTVFDAGCMVIDVEFVFNIGEAVTDGKPVTKKWLTCTGEVRMPSIVRAHVGTPIEDVIALCGGGFSDDFAVIVGDPLTGRVETDMKAPVEKITNGITVLARNHALVARKKTSLASYIRQGKSVGRQDTVCTDLCPRFLLGYDIRLESIMNCVYYGLTDIDESVTRGVFLCGECGLCDIYSGTHGIASTVICAAFKKMLAEKGYSPVFPGRTLLTHEMREGRKVPNRRIIDKLQIKTSTDSPMVQVETEPALVEVPLNQNGVVSQPAVSVGNRVYENECIARAPVSGFGADVHASISGKVTFLDSERIVITR